jgi:hypothetical protein
VHPPPPFPFWPLSPTGPKLLLGVEFEGKELKTLDSFEKALAARGLDYSAIQANNPVSLLLDLNIAAEHGLLRKVVNDWGVIYSLWKTSDAYMEAKGVRRRQMRQLLKYLFFWGSDYPGVSWWPLKLAAGLSLFRRENRGTSVRQRLVRAESLALRLASVLTKITCELQLCSKGSRPSLRDTLLPVINECEAALKEARYFDVNPRPSARSHSSNELQMEEALRAEKLIVELVSTMDRALVGLEHATHRMGPLDAHRAKHVFRQSEAVLRDVLPERDHEPAAIGLFDAFLYVSRLLVGFWLIPLVLVTHGYVRPKTPVRATSTDF